MKKGRKLIIWAVILSILIGTTACGSKSIKTEESLGSVSFEYQKISKTLMYDPKGDEQVLSIKDESGTTWTLTMPPGALLESREITMTALDKIESENLGDIRTGIELKPDGLEFLVPVEIRAENEKLGGEDIILSSDADGQNLEFVEMSSQKYLQANLYHFSNKYALPRTSALDKILLKAAEVRIEIASARAEELLSKPLEIQAPPAIALPEKCNEEEAKQKEASQAIESYLEQFRNPEFQVMRDLLYAMKNYQEIAGKSYDPEYTVVKKIVKRVNEKCDKLIADYKPQSEYFLSVGITVISTQREVSKFDDTKNAVYFDSISDWGVKVINQYLEDIRDKHLYSKAYPIIWLGKQVSIIGGGSLPWDFGSKLFYKLSRVMNFKVEFTDAFTGPDIEMITEGKVKNLSVDVANTSGFYRGEGEGDYKKAVINEEGVSIKQPNKFKVDAILFNFEPCHSDKFSILINAFGPEGDVYVANGYPQAAQGIVNATTGIIFKEYLITDPVFLSAANESLLYEFEIPLQDGQEIAGEKNIKSGLGDVNIDYNIKLVHTPLKTVE